LRATIYIMTMACTFFVFTLAYSSACLYQAAHSPYKLLNSILAKNTRDGEFILPSRVKLKISFYLERFSGPEITNWCWVLFPLTSYEFYLFVAQVSSNFFQIVSLIMWKESVKKNVWHCGSGSSFGLCNVFVLKEHRVVNRSWRPRGVEGIM